MPRYDFSFAWESSYGHVVKLIERLDLPRGVVLDLGCGVGSIAEPLVELGYEYLGADIDPESLARLSQRGLDGRELDLGDLDGLAAKLLELTDGRKVSAVLLMDVIEHLPDTRGLLAAVRAGLELLGRPALLVSVPNVAHVDLAAKLVFGRWDYTTTGLLDSTHTQFFTSERLQADTRAVGLREIDAHDFRLRASDQHFPPEHPALSWSAPIAQAIRMWREAADPHGETVQFVRAFLPGDAGAQLQDGPPPGVADSSPLAVIMRTQGKRAAHLREALTCLAAQTVDDFEVLLMVHSDDGETLAKVRSLVMEFEPAFAARVSVIHVAGGRRARPLNEALERLTAEYVAFLDDDDVVMADWIESFVDAGGEGAIVRSAAAVRHVSIPQENEQVPHLVHSSLEFRYKLDFDPVHHVWGNETPICTFAVPRSLIQAFGIRFDERLPVLEDWDFLMRCVAFAPVRDTRKVTSIYQMWRDGESSASLHHVDLWQATQRVLQDRANQRPVVFPAGSVDQMVKMCERVAELDAARLELTAISNQARDDEELVAEARRVVDELERLRNAYEMTVNSRRWRMLGPFARALAGLRGMVAGPRNLPPGG